MPEGLCIVSGSDRKTGFDFVKVFCFINVGFSLKIGRQLSDV